MSRVKMVSSGVADTSRFTVKRQFNDFNEDDINEIKKLFDNSKIFGDEGEIFFSSKEQHPKYIETIIKQCKALFDIKDEVESTQVTIFPCAKKIGKNEHTIKKTAMNIASRIIIPTNREIFNINISGAGYQGDAKMPIFNGQGFQIIMGACAVAEITYDDTTGAMVPLKKNFRPSKFGKDPFKRYVIVVDGIVDANVLVKSIKNNIGTESNNTNDVDELIKEASKDKPIPVRTPINEEDD
jgi:hypothetical protein